MSFFGPPLAIHGPKKAIVALFLLLAVGALWLGWAVRDTTGRTACVVVGMVLSVLGLWMSRRRVVLYPEGLSYSGLFGQKQLRWDDIVRFYYQGTKQSVNLIPVGTYYWLRLIDSQGQRVRFGSGLARTASLAQKVVELTQAPLLKRIASAFDSGVDVDFGPIRINRQTGITKKGWLGRTKLIPWSEVRSYAIQEGHLYIWRIGEKRTAGYPISNVPNAFALLALLDVIFKPQ
jgi:hypothetical protein